MTVDILIKDLFVHFFEGMLQGYEGKEHWL